MRNIPALNWLKIYEPSKFYLKHDVKIEQIMKNLSSYSRATVYISLQPTLSNESFVSWWIISQQSVGSASSCIAVSKMNENSFTDSWWRSHGAGRIYLLGKRERRCTHWHLVCQTVLFSCLKTDRGREW